VTAAEKQSGKLWGNTFVLLLADGTKKSGMHLRPHESIFCSNRIVIQIKSGVDVFVVLVQEIL
jgi:hypothetical protein